MQRNNSIADINKLRECTSCQVCASVCPKGAISIFLNQDGFYRPNLNEELCVGCGLCKEVCYKYDEDIKCSSRDDLANYTLYSAKAKNRTTLLTTTSGGVAYLLAYSLFKAGYTVIGVVYDSKSGSAKHLAANSVDDINDFKGSKYIQSYSVDAFKQLARNIKSERFAVFGLPCQIYAIARYLDKIHQRDKCILIDLYCHGCPSFNVWKKTLEVIKRKSGVDVIDNVAWRSKAHGWGQFCLSAQSSGKVVYESSPFHNEFYRFFFSNQILNDSCEDCLLRGTLEYSDIRLGDFWGSKFKKDFYGISAISVMSMSGQNAVERICNDIAISNESYDEFLPNQSWNIKYKVDYKMRSALLNALQSGMDIRHILKKYLRPLDFWATIKLIVKQLLFLMPAEMARFIKKVI